MFVHVCVWIGRGTVWGGRVAEHARADFDDIDLRLGQLIIVSTLCGCVCCVSVCVNAYTYTNAEYSGTFGFV